MTNPDFVFEFSSEVCNKVGGIYTVVSSKAAQMMKLYGSGYYAVGLWDPVKAAKDFEEHDPPKHFLKTFKALKREGITCRYGVWLVHGKPQTILVDAEKTGKRVTVFKKVLSKEYGIIPGMSDIWFKRSLKWSYGCGRLLEEIMKDNHFNGRKIVGQFHEWLAGFTILHIHKKKLPIATVFTTHATMLGRSISGAGKDLQQIVEDGLKNNEVASVELAIKYGVGHKHTTEVASVRYADVFTTVSEVTGDETHYLLGKKPDLFLYNGLDLSKVPDWGELNALRLRYRENMKEFLRSYFCRYYDLDVENMRSAFISGRYEFRNKGIDLFIDALGKLNKQMKRKGSKKIFFALLVVPSNIQGENPEVFKNKRAYEAFVDEADAIMPSIRERLVASIMGGKKTSGIMSQDLFKRLDRLRTGFRPKKTGAAPISTFKLSDPCNDRILKALRQNGLLNREEDKVKVVFYPEYISAEDNLIEMDYDSMITTFDVGVFPSFYEPWGYTPLEVAAHGTIAVTSDLSGYGQFMKGRGDGVKVLARRGVEYDKASDELYRYLYKLLNMNKRELNMRRKNAKKLSDLADWRSLVKNYSKAYELALKRSLK